MSICINCGAQMSDGSKYCPKCGFPFDISNQRLGNLTIEWEGQWMLIDAKVHIWADGNKIGSYSFKKGFEVTIPITSAQMKIGVKCSIRSYQPILRMNPFEDHTLHLIYSRITGGFDFILNDNSGKRIQ
ncbi:MAG: zinc ribbon domain-containing protein [Prevotella sp.]|nr:zinc ribbon domain-containing protein [Prevotella sp.]